MKKLLLFLLPCFLFGLSVDESRHLLSRTSFGVTKNLVKILENKNKKEAVEYLLHVDPDLQSYPTWSQNYEHISFKNMNQDEKKVQRKILRAQVIELKSWWMKSMITTKSPLLEKMTLFWHNHFTSSHRKVRSPYLMFKQNETLRRNALGNFKIFLHEISKDEAMIIYLDNQNNVKKSPNENYAREVMELFSLGEGHYSENDIKEAARAFSGWRVNRKKGKFVFVEKLHDKEEKEVLGEKGNFDGDDVLNIILEHKRTAGYLTMKFYKEFINEEINMKEVERISNLFYKSDYEIKVLLREILLSKEFWSQKNRGVLVKSPVELIVGTLRSFNIVPKNTKGLVLASKQLKQDIFNPPNVKGWDGGISWLDSNSLLYRNQVISRFVRGKMVNKMGMSKMKNIEPIQEYFLALKPVNNIDYKKDKIEVISAFVLDPVYQLK